MIECIPLGIKTCKRFLTVNRSREVVLINSFEKDIEERDLAILLKFNCEFLCYCDNHLKTVKTAWHSP